MSNDEEWTEDLSEDKDKPENEWIPVIMAGIIVGAVVFMCLICGQTITTAVTAIWRP